MTHHLNSDMLGVRREGVTVAARKLQESGLIRYVRSHITVLDRPGLEQRVCECYRVVKKGKRSSASGSGGRVSRWLRLLWRVYEVDEHASKRRQIEIQGTCRKRVGWADSIKTLKTYSADRFNHVAVHGFGRMSGFLADGLGCTALSRM